MPLAVVSTGAALVSALVAGAVLGVVTIAYASTAAPLLVPVGVMPLVPAAVGVVDGAFGCYLMAPARDM